MLPEPVVVTAYVSSWECSGLCLVHAGFETSWSKYVVNLIVHVSIRQVPRYSPLCVCVCVRVRACVGARARVRCL